MKIINGYVACGEENSILLKIDELINSGYSSNEILLLTLNSASIEKFKVVEKKNVNVKTFSRFVQEVLNKININTPQIISDFIAIQIIYSISKKKMVNNSALKNLCKSISFSRELYNLFGLFKINNVSVEELLEINTSEKIKTEDKERFKIIVQIFDEYKKILKQNSLLDYRDTVLELVEKIKTNSVFKNALKSHYKHIFVYEAQDLNLNQLELLKLINEENLELYVDKNASIQGFKGASILGDNNEIEFKNSCRNQDILKRALYITQGDFYIKEKSESIEYRLFSDAQDEINYIAKDIIKELENGTKPAELAVLARDNSIKQNFIDIFNLYSIPVNAELYSEEYQTFKYRLNRLLNMFDIFERLNLSSFNSNGFKNINIESKVDEEILAEQMNLYVENILAENVENKYSLKEIESLRERYSNIFMAETVWKSQNIFSDEDRLKVNLKLKMIDRLYQFYKSNDIIAIIIELADVKNSNDENYNKFVARFLTNLKQLSELKLGILAEKIDYKTISDLLEMTLEENDDNEEKVNLLTFFKAAGQEFKKVYIPNLTDGYFPKKSKWTYFISKPSNKILSNLLNKTHPDFGTIIKTNKEELLDEERLFYVALTSAKEKVFVSTHKYEDKKQIQPSSFFEQLMFSDEDNFVSDETAKIDEVEAQNTIIDDKIIEKTSETVVQEDDLLKLSASSITTFLECPKKFYYKHLLELKEPNNFSSNYGTIVHSVFEVLLSKHLEDFSPDMAMKLGLALFEVKSDETKAVGLGFDEKSIENIKELNDLDYCEMKENFVDAINNLANTDFFDEKPIDATCEKYFKFSLNEFKNVVFSGYIDAIIKYSNGCKIIDYKSGKNKPDLTKIISEEGVNFLSRGCANKGQFSEKNMKEFAYQIPLYYFACENSEDLEEFKNSIEKVGYQYVRPAYKNGGSSDNFIEATELEKFKNKIIENLKTYVIDKIRTKSEFEPIYNQFGCANCKYGDICELANNSEDSKND